MTEGVQFLNPPGIHSILMVVRAIYLAEWLERFQGCCQRSYVSDNPGDGDPFSPFPPSKPHQPKPQHLVIRAFTPLHARWLIERRDRQTGPVGSIMLYFYFIFFNFIHFALTSICRKPMHSRFISVLFIHHHSSFISLKY